MSRLSVYNSRNINSKLNTAVSHGQSAICEGDIYTNEKNCHNRIDRSLSEYISDIVGKIDSDKLLIGTLMYLMYKEKADLKLIVALAYILL